MSEALNVLLRKLWLPALAIAIGASFATGLEPLDAGTCRAYEGGVSGNDPDARTTLVLCRADDRVYGRLRTEGRSGVSVGEVVGELDEDGRTLSLVGIDALVNEPNPGWMFCYDDVYALRWDPSAQRLSGTYRSEACDDTGTLIVIPRDR
jgi:hypothetical protein